jgi:UDP-N-acetylglucosamine 2-epimerase (non-hydrolysing)
MKEVLVIVGTRPNFIKITQFKKVSEKFENLNLKILHTGQHYDERMSSIFFKQFDINPDIFLQIAPNPPAIQIGDMIQKLGEYLESNPPDFLFVVGDVNSTLAAAIAANKSKIPFGHIESGLRSRDRSMPEEINRILTDELADHFFITEQSGYDNLISNGKSKESCHFVGNTMIDTLIAFENNIEKSDILSKLDLLSKEYFLITMHRPSNVDDKSNLKKIISLTEKLAKEKHVVFPIHPRTKDKLVKFGLFDSYYNIENLTILEPLDYFSFQKLIKYANYVITDSGGIQEETTFRKIPCITLRQNTERPVTIEKGSNTLMDFEIDEVISKIKNTNRESYSIPKFWDGKSSERIFEILSNQILK